MYYRKKPFKIRKTGRSPNQKTGVSFILRDTLSLLLFCGYDETFNNFIVTVH